MKKIIVACLLVVVAFSYALAAGSAKLTWTPPTVYVDGTPLPDSDITGFTVYHGTSARTYTDKIPIGAAARTYTFPALPQGDHFFAVTVTVKNGLESDYSPEGIKNIPPVKAGACGLIVE